MGRGTRGVRTNASAPYPASAYRRQSRRSTAVALLVLGCVVGCSEDGGPRGPEGDSSPGGGKADDVTPENVTLEEYAEHCEEQVGPIPEMHCPDGDLIPMTRTNPDGSVTEISHESLLAEEGIITCDSPVQVLNAEDDAYRGCLPNSRLVSHVSTNDRGEEYQWVSICRHFQPRGPQEYVYDEIGTIGYNKTTGATCFLAGARADFEQDGEEHQGLVKGRNRPGTDDPEFATHYALPTDGGCVRCHNADPWIFNPYVDEVIDSDTGDLKRWAQRSRRGAPFYVVDGDPLQQMFGGDAPRDGTSHTLAAQEAPRCTGCHDIGNRYICSRFTPAAFEPDDGLEHDWAIDWRRYLSDGVLQSPAGGAWHLNHLPDIRTLATREAMVERFESRYGSSYDRVRECCDTENSPKCEWTTNVGGASIPPSGGEPPPDSGTGGHVRFTWYRPPARPANFDVGRDKVAIFIHGWHQTGKADSLFYDFTFGGVLPEDDLVDHAAELQEQGYNVAILDWFGDAHTDKISQAERNVYTRDFGEDLVRAFRVGLKPVHDAALARGEQLDVRVVGHSLGCQVAGRLANAIVFDNDYSIDPDRIACIDPYFSRPSECDVAEEEGCMRRSAGAELQFDPAATTLEALALYSSTVFHRNPNHAIEIYATDDLLFELVGDANDELLRTSALVKLTPGTGGVSPGSINPLDWIWDWGNRRHTYPLYWYFATWVLQHDAATKGGISAATPPGPVRESMKGGFFFQQISGSEDDDMDPVNDRFERRSHQ